MKTVEDIMHQAMSQLETDLPQGSGIVIIIQPSNDANATRLLHNASDEKVAMLLRALSNSASNDRGSRPSHPTLQ